MADDNPPAPPVPPVPPVPAPTPSDSIINNPPAPVPDNVRKKLETRISELEQALAEQKITLAEFNKKVEQLVAIPKGRDLWQQIEDLFS